MKKFVVHCNRCTVVTRFFGLDFVRILKEGTLGTRLLSKNLICLNMLIFLLQTDLEEISQLFKLVQKIGKTFILLNWSQNEQGLLEKDVRAF